MSWYSLGAENAEKMAASSERRRTRNFFTRANESAVIRFLAPAADSFNYKRSFVKWAKGSKLLTSPGTHPDPFVEAGLSLQSAFAWLIVDRRVLEFEDRVTGESRTVGPRVLYFADGQRTRKQLLAFERELLESHNEELAEDGKEPLTLAQFNLSHYDIKVSKEPGAPWNFVARRPKPLSDEDKELVEKYSFSLEEELKPYPVNEIKAILGQNNGSQNGHVDEEEPTLYSYDSDNEDTIKFE